MKELTGDPKHQVIADAALFRRVQQSNQAEVIAKLLHDLRNPVHSMRITVELFSRIVEPGVDTSALLARAARYVAPAETAITSLSRQTERLAIWLGPPAQPKLQPIEVNDWLAEIAVLLRESRRSLEVGVESGVSNEISLLADRARLSHAFLSWGLGSVCESVVLSAVEEAGRIRLSASRLMDPEPDLRTLIASAGGQVELNAGRGATLTFARG